MNLMKFADKHPTDTFCCSWLPDGKSFVISNPDEFTRKILPKYFKATKFSSFTRKLYRWGFRQVNRGIGPDDPIIFGNEFFQRDNAELMAKMRSVTAASTRKKVEEDSALLTAQKRSLATPDHKEILLNQIMQQQNMLSMNRQPLFGSQNQAFANALRPGLGSAAFGGMGGNNFKPFGNLLKQSNPLISSFSSMQGNNNIPSISNPNYLSSASTAEIVNAAINALRYAP